ncbi:efflux RND transporter periplasmic adaptor subunit [Phyllobacterium sp. YR531]|uniref:efflux RND transporter periplasmic adaptor subunit n=1 Tax=Phyllobacterium sp. YR531 TaxID=1144343 RepID=UPI00026F9007|nr:efflux RND transporter periplasmic adaptor subunit [Phyllobacterium sp. YR531]EJN02166.1 RND family efflux transporter, MFP subunit [Phyllobacterium sp. YR531]
MSLIKFPLSNLVAVPLLVLLAACNQESKSTPPPTVTPEVSAVTLEPQPVAITAELPGRTSASVIAEVRPQVGGIIRSRNFREGSDVKQGDVLYEIDPSFYQAAYDNAKAAVERAQGALPTAKARFDRYANLNKTNVISQQDLDDSQSTYAQAQADVAAANAALETARINLDYTKIRAPIDGRVDASTVTVGALVTAGQTTALATIRKLDPINVDVTQSSVNFLKLRHALDEGRLKRDGSNVSVSLALEDGSTYKQTGTLEFSEATVAESVGTINVRATFPNPDRMLLPGMYVRATVEEGVAENSYLVPQRAVSRNTKGEATAKFVTAEGKVEDRVLPVQRAIGNNWLVSEGVKQGDRVIVEGSQRISTGQEVNVSVVTIDDATGVLRQASLPSDGQSAELAQAEKTVATGAVE